MFPEEQSKFSNFERKSLTPSNHAKRGAGKARRRALAADNPGASHIVTQGLEAHHRGMRWQKVVVKLEAIPKAITNPFPYLCCFFGRFIVYLTQ